MKTLQDKIQGAIKDLKETTVYPLILDLQDKYLKRGFLNEREKAELTSYIEIALKEKYE